MQNANNNTVTGDLLQLSASDLDRLKRAKQIELLEAQIKAQKAIRKNAETVSAEEAGILQAYRRLKTEYLRGADLSAEQLWFLGLGGVGQHQTSLPGTQPVTDDKPFL